LLRRQKLADAGRIEQAVNTTITRTPEFDPGS